MLIDIDKLKLDKEQIEKQWSDPKKPFRYFIYDGFFKLDAAEKILANYPSVTQLGWDNTTYINQKNKFTLTKFGKEAHLLKEVFDELNSEAFLQLMSEITGIENLLGDEELFGGGLHQSRKGAFLDVHVDFNIHPKTKQHRRMNLIIYMNKDWKEEYNGYLELWDMDKKKQIEYVAPIFNRCVVFETNEISFHGHPKKLNTPDGTTRKSLAVYYYTKERSESETVSEHNTIYKNTEGIKGKLKNIKSGIKAFFERM